MTPEINVFFPFISHCCIIFVSLLIKVAHFRNKIGSKEENKHQLYFKKKKSTFNKIFFTKYSKISDESNISEADELKLINAKIYFNKIQIRLYYCKKNNRCR